MKGCQYEPRPRYGLYLLVVCILYASLLILDKVTKIERRLREPVKVEQSYPRRIK